MRSGFLPTRVVHVHPTRACNLACAHCYSGSSPANRSALEPGPLLGALRVLRGEGYETLSVSGGEPLVYPGLETLLRGAADCGYRVQLVTNGLLLSHARLSRLEEHVQLLAVSFDGGEQVHNQVRRRRDAFRKANAALDVLARGHVAFGVAFGVSRHSLADIPSAYDRAHEVGAALLHLRPLVSTGRARELDEGWMLTQADCARVSVLRDLLDTGAEAAPRVQLDLLTAEEVARGREQFPHLDEGATLDSLSDLVNPLVIDDVGRLVPFTYGVHSAFTIANVHRDLGRCIARYKAGHAARTVALLRCAFADTQSRAEYVDWFGHLTAVSERLGAELGGATPASRA